MPRTVTALRFEYIKKGEWFLIHHKCRYRELLHVKCCVPSVLYMYSDAIVQNTIISTPHCVWGDRMVVV